MNSATKPKPPIIDADFDEAMRAMLSVKPSPSGKKAKAKRRSHRSTKASTTKLQTNS
jgi:hypothetical protein